MVDVNVKSPHLKAKRSTRLIFVVAAILAAAALTACGCGTDDAATVVSPAADTATQTTPPATVIGTADRACRDAAGNDVECK